MDSGLDINRLLKKIHFTVSIFIFVFALVYVFSGLVIAKGNWFSHQPDTVIKMVYPLNYHPDSTRVKQFGNDIKQQFDISGRMSYQRNWKKELVFTYYRPMVRNVVTVHPALDSITVVCTKNINFHEANKRIHRVHGFQGGIFYVIWGTLLDLTAISMIIFAVTGILIWFRWRRFMRAGWFIIVPTVMLAIVMVIFLL